MNKLDLVAVRTYVGQNIGTFHVNRLRKVESLHLQDALKRKNLYMFRVMNMITASDIVASILDAYLSSSEETQFGSFLEKVAIYVNNMVYNGHKSTSPGLDLDCVIDQVRYLVSIKSGSNWGNSSQKKKLETDFQTALKVVRQGNAGMNVRAVLGVCYGRKPPTDHGNYLELTGQAFWSFISGSPEFYVDLIEPLGYEAQTHNERYQVAHTNAFNRFVREFSNDYCNTDGSINWHKLIEFNSKNTGVISS